MVIVRISFPMECKRRVSSSSGSWSWASVVHVVCPAAVGLVSVVAIVGVNVVGFLSLLLTDLLDSQAQVFFFRQQLDKPPQRDITALNIGKATLIPNEPKVKARTLFSATRKLLLTVKEKIVSHDEKNMTSTTKAQARCDF